MRNETLSRIAMAALWSGVMWGALVQIAPAQQGGAAPSYQSQTPLQRPGGAGPDMNTPPGSNRDTGADGMMTRLQEQQAKTRNTERQKKLETDTQRLLSLATELKEQVAKTDRNVLSVEVIRKAEEIEKLARSVKERMKG